MEGRSMKVIKYIVLLFASFFGLATYAQSDKKREITSQDSLDYCMRQAKKALNARNASATYRWYRRAVRFHSPSAQLALANCYYWGYGTERNFEKAYYLYNKAAEQGDRIAEYSLGNCYYYGHGTKKDYEQAVNWYRLSASKGYFMAYFNLGCCYKDGVGTSRNYRKAVENLEKAANDSILAAVYMLGTVYDAKDNDWAGDKKKAFDYYLQAAMKGYPQAQYKVGVCYETGTGGEKDYDKAMDWYLKAADNGNLEAQFKVGRCYYHGLRKRFSG